jgi:hypothetical protein
VQAAVECSNSFRSIPAVLKAAKSAVAVSIHASENPAPFRGALPRRNAVKCFSEGKVPIVELSSQVFARKG